MLCLCCLVSLLKNLNRTKWFCCLHLVVIFPFLLFCFEFWIFSFCDFSVLSKKDPPKKGHSKNPKSKNAQKTDKKKSVCAIVFTNSVPNFLGVGLKMQIFAENNINIVVSAYFEKLKRAKNVEKVVPKIDLSTSLSTDPWCLDSEQSRGSRTYD